MKNIEQILNEKLFDKDPPENPLFTSYLCRAINALGIYSKGFKKCTKEANERFIRCINLMVQALKLLPYHEELRSKILFYIHRMIDCLQKEIFPYIPALLNQMMDPIPSVQSFFSVIRLINQLITSFKKDVSEMLDALLPSLTKKVFDYYQRLEDPSEQKELQRFYFLFIQSILTADLYQIFFIEKNSSHFISYFAPIIQACKGEITDNTKVCSFM